VSKEKKISEKSKEIFLKIEREGYGSGFLE